MTDRYRKARRKKRANMRLIDRLGPQMALATAAIAKMFVPDKPLRRWQQQQLEREKRFAEIREDWKQFKDLKDGR